MVPRYIDASFLKWSLVYLQSIRRKIPLPICERLMTDLCTKDFGFIHRICRRHFVALAQNAGITVESVAMEGRSYIGILHLAKTRRCDLIALGADGLGAIGDGMLGGTTSRVLHNAPCDVFVARCASNGGPILTGVDGSREALKAVSKAVALGRTMNRPVHFVAAHTPIVMCSRFLLAQRSQVR